MKGNAIAWEPITAPNQLVRYIRDLPPEVDDRLSAYVFLCQQYNVVI